MKKLLGYNLSRSSTKREGYFTVMKKPIGFIFGILGFCLPFILNFDGLSFAGTIALSIFLMAAMLWLFEPIPIHGTSLLVISLGIFLLSNESIIFKGATLPTSVIRHVENNLYEIPQTALTNDNKVYVYVVDSKGETTLIHEVTVISKESDRVIIQSDKLNPSSLIVTDIKHKLVGYKPVNYTDYFYSLANSVIMLFLGGLLLADAAVKYNLDKNITRVVLKPFGYKPAMITLGMLSVTALVSAFMSNTAATAMMMTVVLPIIAQLDLDDPFRKAVVLAIPFGANLGGIATPVGTPPNAVVLAALLKQGITVPFGTWILLALPYVIIMCTFAWWLLMRIYTPKNDRFELKITSNFDKSKKAVRLYVIFSLTILFWTTEALHKVSSNIIAFFAVTALVLTSVVDVKDIRRLPWEILWLVAGGIALDITMRATGLSSWLISQVAWSQLTGMAILAGFSIVAILFSTFISNTVTATLLAPLAVGIATTLGGGFSVAIAAIVLGVATSCAMALPISTPPNAIAMSTGMIDTRGMAKIGTPIGVFGILLLLLFAKFYWPLIVN